MSQGEGGWVLFVPWPISEDLVVRVRFALGEDDRLEPCEMHLDGTSRLDADLLQRLPLRQMEAWANGGPERDELIEQIRKAGPRVEDATERWRERVASDKVRLNPKTWKGVRRNQLKLRVPTDLKKPDAFYARVGELYTLLAASGSRGPAKEIADANEGVEVTTVHRWIKEARRRRLLGSGRRGKAG